MIQLLFIGGSAGVLELLLIGGNMLELLFIGGSVELLELLFIGGSVV